VCAEELAASCSPGTCWALTRWRWSRPLPPARTRAHRRALPAALLTRGPPRGRPQAEVGSKLQLGRVLALKEAGEFHVGRPYLEDVRIEADVIDEVKAPKVIIFKMRAKKHYRRKTGHRQPLTKFLITKIERA